MLHKVGAPDPCHGIELKAAEEGGCDRGYAVVFKHVLYDGGHPFFIRNAVEDREDIGMARDLRLARGVG